MRRRVPHVCERVHLAFTLPNLRRLDRIQPAIVPAHKERCCELGVISASRSPALKKRKVGVQETEAANGSSVARPVRRFVLGTIYKRRAYTRQIDQSVQVVVAACVTKETPAQIP